MIHLSCNPTSMSQNMPAPNNIPMQTSQNNFQMFQQPQSGSTQMHPSPSTVCNNQEQHKQPSYQFYQGEVFNPSRQNTSNITQPTSLCQPYFQPSYNTSLPVESQQKPVESLPQSILEQIRACVSSMAPIFILPGGCHQSANHQQSPTISRSNQPEISHNVGQQPGFNYPSPPPVYCPPPFYPYPIPMPIYDPSATSAANRNKVENCECQKIQAPLINCKGRSQCQCDVEYTEHQCTRTTDDTLCTKLNCPSSINLQALASQLLSVPGIISCAATRLILRKIPGSNITTTMEGTMDIAQRSISALTKDQLIMESRIAQQVTALINLHMNNNPPANIVPILTLIQLKVNLLKVQVDTLINKKVMENEGYNSEVDPANTIDPRILALKSDSELRQLLSALRQKECDERVNVNFAPYHSQRAIAEVRLNTVKNKIRQVEGEFEKRRRAGVPITSDMGSSQCPYTSPCTGSKYTDVNPSNNTRFYESPDPFAIRVRSPRRLSLKPHVGCPQTTYDNSTPSKSTENTVTPSENKSTETQKQETEDKSNATIEEKQNQTSDEISKVEDREECTFCNRQISNESSGEDKKKLRTMTPKAEKATAVISTDKLRKMSRKESSSMIAAEKDDTGLTLKTNKIDSGYDEVTSDKNLPKAHRLSETLNVRVTKEDIVGIDSTPSLHKPVKGETTETIKRIKPLALMESKILKDIEYKGIKEHGINDTEQLIFVAVKQEQTEQEHINERGMTVY